MYIFSFFFIVIIVNSPKWSDNSGIKPIIPIKMMTSSIII